MADNTIFSTLTMNPQALHLDAAFSSGTEFGERLVNSLLTMAITVGLSVGHLTQGTIVANLGFSEVSFPHPVRIGDTIYAETEVLQLRVWVCQGTVNLKALSHFRLCRTFGGDVPLAEQDAMPEEVEPGSSVHLPLDHFRLVVDAFGSPVVVRERDRGGGGRDVEVEAAGEGVQVRQVSGAGVGDPLLELVLVSGAGGQHGGAGADQAGHGVHLLAGRREPCRRLALPVREVVRPGEQDLCCLAGRDVRPFGVGAALVEVADEEVGAAGVAALADLPQQLLDGDSGFLGASFAQVVAVRVDQGGPVLGCAAQPLGRIGPVVALDRVQGQAQAAGAVQQAGAFAAQVVDLLPALARGLRALPFRERGALGPAGGMSCDFLRLGPAPQMPQVPAVPALHRVRQRGTAGLAVGARAVTGDDLRPGVLAEPALDDIGSASFQDIDAPAGLGVNQDGRVDEPAAQREIVNPQDAGYFEAGQADRQQGPERGMPGDADAQDRQQPRRGPAR